MFLDVAVPFHDVPYIDRVEIGFCTLSKIPERIVMSIVYLAKAIFNGLIALLACGQSKMFNMQFIAAFLSLFNESGKLLLTPLALFAPLKTLELQAELQKPIVQLVINARNMVATTQSDKNKVAFALNI